MLFCNCARLLRLVRLARLNERCIINICFMPQNQNSKCTNCGALLDNLTRCRQQQHRDNLCPKRKFDVTAVTSQCDSTTTSTASLDRNVGPEFYQTTYEHLLTDKPLDNDEAGDEEEDNRDADVGDHRDDELLAKLLDPERNQHLTYDEIQRCALSIYDSEDESGDPSSLPVEATTPAQQRAETVVNPGAQTKLTAKEYALFQMQHKLKDGLSDRAFNINTKFLQKFFTVGDGNSDDVPSYVTCKKILEMEDAMDYTVHFCPQYHRCWKQIKQDEWPDHENDVCGHPMRGGSTCGQRRFLNRRDKRGRLIPTRYFYFFGIKKAIREWFATETYSYLRSRPDARPIDDIWGGLLVQRMNGMNPKTRCRLDEKQLHGRPSLNGELLHEDIYKFKDGSVAHLRKHELLDFGCDGIQVFKNIIYGVGLMLVRPFGVPAVVRGKKEFTKLIGIIPGPNEGVDKKHLPKKFTGCEAYRRVFMAPLVSELLELGKYGIDVRDPYMERMTGGRFEYNMKFHMATCTGDTPMRAKIACTYNQTGHRGDQYNYWSGCSVDRFTKRHLGYAEPQEQPAASSMLGNIKLGAFDKRVYRGPQGEIVKGVARDPYTDGGMFTHAKALELHKLVEAGLLEERKAGRYCMPPFAQLPLFDLCWGYALPVVHALVWGVEKTFWLSIIDDDSKNNGKIEHYMPPEVRKEIQKLGGSIKCPHDEGRPYTDIIVNKRMWKMENWLHFAESYCLAFHKALYDWNKWVFKAWSHLRYAIMHCMSSYGWYEGLTREEYIQKSELAQQHLREFARICEEKKLDKVLTLNLRLISANLTYQEMHLGSTRNVHEFWVERGCQAYGKVGDASVRHPEKYIANRYLLENACNRAISEGVRDVYSEVANEKKDTGPNRDVGKPGESFFLGPGTIVTFGEKDDERRSQELAPLAGMGALKFHRASIRGQVVTAVDYIGHQTRVSYSVCVKTDPSHDDDDEEGDDDAPRDLCASIYGNVLGFYKIEQTAERLLEIECYDIVTNKELDRKILGYERVDMAKKTTILMPLEKFRHKLQFFQTPDMESAIVMNQWSLGKT